MIRSIRLCFGCVNRLIHILVISATDAIAPRFVVSIVLPSILCLKKNPALLKRRETPPHGLQRHMARLLCPRHLPSKASRLADKPSDEGWTSVSPISVHRLFSLKKVVFLFRR